MKIYTNENNTSTLKLLIAANLAGKQVEVKNVTLGDKIHQGPCSLPTLEVDDELVFFSSNAAVQYLFPILDLSENGKCQQMLEWEATRLYPIVQTLLAAKTAPADLKQLFSAAITDIDNILSKKKYILGDTISSADVSVWSTLQPVSAAGSESALMMQSCVHLERWLRELGRAKAVQDAVERWGAAAGGAAGGAGGSARALGLPSVPSLSPVGTPEEEATAARPTAAELAAARDAWLRGAERLPRPCARQKVILPVKGRRNVLITSALPYVNNVPHLGNIIGCVLSADIFARYCRLCNYNTLYICGTDEYGTATETKALEEGLTPREICDKYYAIHNDVYRWFDIGFDHFGRTSTPEQTEIVQKLFLKLQSNGFISKQSVDQLMCQKCDRFLADRFVEGECHHAGCGYEDARGDQCDRCGRLVNATELLRPRCKVCGETPVLRASEQLFIELGMLEPAVRAWGSARLPSWSPAARGVARGWLREGLRARAVTRDLKWGVPVPGDGGKVFYVWFDAPIGYMSITQAATKQYEKWWKPEKEYDVKLYQFMAKDNVPFHAVMFPATLLGVGDGHLMVDRLFATEYLNYEEGKFSKSRGVGVFGTDAQDTGIPADVWRFYLASIRPETSDSSFSWTELGTRNNSELLNNLGNFCHRSLSFCHASLGARVPQVVLDEETLELFALVNREIVAYVEDMERGRLRDALRRVLAVSRLGNQRMQAAQPWALLKGTEEDKARAASVVGACCQLAACLCVLVAPFTPAAARRLAAQLDLPLDDVRIDAEHPSLVPYLKPGQAVAAPQPLFAKIEPATLEALRKRYAGTQADRREKSGAAPPSGDAKELEAEVAKQANVMRKLKASTKDKAVWQPEVDKLLALKKQLAEIGKASAPVTSASCQSAESLEKAIAEQGEVVRKLKASTKDKAVWQPEVNKLLALKKQLAEVGKTSAPVTTASGQSAENLEKAIAEQGDVVRKLKSSTKDKAVWQPEVDKLLALKKQLAEVGKSSAPVTSASGQTVESLEKAIAEQGDKVRKLKASTKDKAVWQPEVSVLLDLKKQLAALQVK